MYVDTYCTQYCVSLYFACKVFLYDGEKVSYLYTDTYKVSVTRGIMIKIDRFVFDKFLPPQEGVAEEEHWLHFVRQDGTQSDQQDVEDLNKIIQESGIESDEIQYIRTTNYRELSSTGEIYLPEDLPQGIIVRLKGGTETEALEYCRRIAESSKSKTQ